MDILLRGTCICPLSSLTHFTLKTGRARSSETVVFYRVTTRRHYHKDLDLDFHRRENLKHRNLELLMPYFGNSNL